MLIIINYYDFALRVVFIYLKLKYAIRLVRVVTNAIKIVVLQFICEIDQHSGLNLKNTKIHIPRIFTLATI